MTNPRSRLRILLALPVLLFFNACDQPPPEGPPPVVTQEQVAAAQQLPMCERAVAMIRLHAETLRQRGIDPEAAAANVARMKVSDADGRVVAACPEIDTALVESVMQEVER